MSFKRILSLVLVLCMVLSFFPASAFADNDFAEEEVIEEVVEEPAAEEPVEEETPAPAEEEQPAPAAAEVEEEVVDEQQPASVEEEVVVEEVEAEAQTFSEDAMAATIVAQIGDQTYDSIDAAFNAVRAGQTIDVLRSDYMREQHNSVPSCTLKGEGQTITLDSGSLSFAGGVTFNRVNFDGDFSILSGGLTVVGTCTFGNVRVNNVATPTDIQANVQAGTFTSIDDCLIADGFKAENYTGAVGNGAVVADTESYWAVQIGTGAERVRYTGDPRKAAAVAVETGKTLVLLRNCFSARYPVKLEREQTLIVNPNGFSVGVDGVVVNDSVTSELSVSVDPSTGISTYTAVPKGYTVTFDSMGGSEVSPYSSLVIKYNSTVTKGQQPYSPTRDGYNFAGWFQDEACTVPFVFGDADTGTKITGDTTVYAGWTAIEYTLVYQPFGGKAPESPTTYKVTDGTVEVPAPDHPGFTFRGWFATNTDVNPDSVTGPYVTPFNLTPETAPALGDNADHKIYFFAGYQQELYTVTFDSMGGSAVNPITGKTYNSTITTDVQPVNPTYVGYTFNGWFQDEECTVPFVFGDAGTGTKITGDTTLYAGWTINEYTLVYQTYGGTAPESPTTYKVTDGTVEVPAPDHPGFTFNGWVATNTDVDPQTGYVTPYTLTPETAPSLGNNDDHKIYFFAGYTQKVFTVTFVGNGGQFQLNSGVVVSGYENSNKHYQDDLYYPVADPVWAGHTFLGWSLNGSEDLIETAALPKTCPDADVAELTYTAQWDVKMITVTFDTDGGSVIEPMKDEAGSPLTWPANPTKEGYTYKTWNYADGRSLPAILTEFPTEDTAFKVEWVINEYSYEFTAATGTDLKYGGASQSNPFTVTANYNAAIKAVEASKEGSVFVGWYMVTKDEWDEEIWTPYSETIPNRMPALDLVENAGTAYNAETKTLTLTALFDVKQITVTFVDEDGTTIATETGKFGDPLTWPTDLTKDGYTFDEWVNAAGIPVSPQTVPTFPSADHTFTAKWTANKYTYEFTKDGGTLYVNGVPAAPEDNTLRRDFGAEIGVVTITKDGYTFDGWTIGDTTEKYVIPETMPALDKQEGSVGNTLSLKANWTANDVTVTFVDEDGTVIATESGKVGAALTWPTGLTKEGYTFDKWVNASGIPVTPTSVPTFPTIDHTFTAKWTANSYKFKFVDLDGLGYSVVQAPGTPISGIEQDYNTVFPEIRVTATGYTHTGWVIVSKDSWGQPVETPYEFPDKMPAVDTIDGSYKVGNIWTLDLKATFAEDVLTISYELDGGKLPEGVTNPETFTVTESVKITAPEREGYDFTGWKYVTGDKSGTTPADYTGFGPGEVVEDLSLTATWAIKTYGLTLNLDGGSIVPDQGYWALTYGQALPVINDPTKNGYTFDGWVDETGAAAVFPESMPAQNLTYKATWKLNSYDLTYVYGEGGALPEGKTNPESYTVEDGEVVIEQPVMEGFTFDGWTIKQNGVSSTVDASWKSFEAANNTGAIEFTARWSRNSYTYQFVTYGGTTVDSITKQFGQSFMVPANPTKDGYDFGGWFVETTDEFGEKVYTEYTITSPMTALDTVKGSVPGTDPVKATLTLHAKWTAHTTTITFDSNGGSEVAPITQEVGTTVAKPADPTKENYDFAGWYDAAGKPVDWTNPIPMPTKDVTFTAHWSLSEYTYHLDAKGGNIKYRDVDKGTNTDLTLKTGAPIHSIEVTRDGYTFGGWIFITEDIYGEKTQHSYEIPRSMPNLELQKEEFGTAYENHVLSLEALWTVDLVTVSFDTDGGTEIASITGEAGAPLNNWPSELPTKEGYSFANYKYADGTPLLAPLTQFPTEDTTFTAVWDPYTYKFILDADGGTVKQAGSSASIDKIEQAFGTDIAAVSARKPGFGFVEWYYVTTDEWGDETEHSYEIPATMPAIDQIEGATVYDTGSVRATLTLHARWLGDAHTINYDYKGGTLPEGKTNPTNFEIGDTVTIVAPVKEGNEFTGWHYVIGDPEDGGKEGDLPAAYTGFSGTEVTDDITFTAKFTVKTYTLTFDGNGGAWNNGASKTITRDVTYGAVIDPDVLLGGSNPKFIAKAPYEATDFDFDSWEGYTEGMTMPAENVTFKAAWAAHNYSLVYAFNPALEEGEVPVNENPENYNVETETFSFVDPYREAYDFVGWKWTDDMEPLPSNQVVFTKGENHGDATWTAVFEGKKHTLTFDGNGGTWNGGLDDFDQPIRVPVIVRENVPYKTVISTELPGENPVRPGYTFVKWEGYKDTDTMPNEDKTYKAVWKADVQTIYLHKNDGTAVESIRAYTDAEITAPEDPTAKGYTFDGWYKDEALTQKLESFPTTMPAGGMDLYAKWILDVYTITLDLAGGVFTTPTDLPIKYSFTDEAFSIPEPYKTGYQFDGWTGEDLEEPTKDLVIAQYSVGDREYTANWTAWNYPVIYMYNDSTFISMVYSPYDQLVTKPEDPKITGYTFMEWTTDSAGEKPFDFENTPLDENVLVDTGKPYGFALNLFAQFQINKYTVTFDSDGGTVIDPQVKEYNTLVTKPEDPWRDGYTFGGWYEVLEDGSLAPKPWNFKSSKVVDDTTLKAKWIGEPRRIFWMNGNELLSEEIVYVGDPLVEFVPSPLPTRDGYMLDPDNLWDPEVPATVPAYKSNPQVYQLNWIKLNTVFFVRDGKVIQTVEVPMNQTLEGNPDVPVIPPKAGFKAVWMLDDEYFDLATPISEDKLTLVATYVQQYVVKFVNYDGTLLSSALYQKGETPVEPDTPTREATAEATYEFAGWTPAVAPVSADVTYTATYNETKNKYTVVFENYDGTVLQSSEVAYGEMPEYTSNEKPIKPDTAAISYVWSGWDPVVEPVDGNAIYTATFTESTREYQIRFLNDDYTELQKSNVAYGKKPVYEGETPTKAPTAETVYTFKEWKPEVVDVVSSATYTATYTESPRMYTVTFENAEGVDPDAQMVEYRHNAQDPGAAETDKVGIEFVGWFEQNSATAFDFSTKITKDTVLEARWVPLVEEYSFLMLLNMEDYTGINVFVHIPDGADPADYVLKTVSTNSMYTESSQEIEISLANLNTRTREGVLYYRLPDAMKAASTEMTDKLEVTLLKNGEVVKTEVYSIYSIVKDRLASGTLSPADDKLHRALLQYGRSAQIAFDHKTTDMPEVSGAPALVPIPSSYAAQGDPTNFSAYISKFEGSVEMAEAAKMNIYLTPAAGYGTNDFEVSVTKDGVPYEKAAISTSRGRIKVQITGFASFEMDSNVQITVKLKSTGATAIWTRSLMTCAYEKFMAETEQPWKNLWMSLYQYFLAAQDAFIIN